MLVVLRRLGAEPMSDARISAALLEAERAAPAAGALLREALSELQTTVTAFEEGRIDTHMARLLSRTAVHVQAMGADTADAARAAQAAAVVAQAAATTAQATTERLAALIGEVLVARTEATDSGRLMLAHGHAERLAALEDASLRERSALEAATERARIRERVLIALIPTVGVVAGGLTYWLTGWGG